MRRILLRPRLYILVGNGARALAINKAAHPRFARLFFPARATESRTILRAFRLRTERTAAHIRTAHFGTRRVNPSRKSSAIGKFIAAGSYAAVGNPAVAGNVAAVGNFTASHGFAVRADTRGIGNAGAALFGIL